jgi:hypothetical protein
VRHDNAAYENKNLMLNIRPGAFDHMETIHALEPGVKEKIPFLRNDGITGFALHPSQSKINYC